MYVFFGVILGLLALVGAALGVVLAFLGVTGAGEGDIEVAIDSIGEVSGINGQLAVTLAGVGLVVLSVVYIAKAVESARTRVAAGEGFLGVGWINILKGFVP